ncbi:MAG: hypothetical protein RL514_3002 [Verrucomicrobiota bacterium]
MTSKPSPLHAKGGSWTLNRCLLHAKRVSSKLRTLPLHAKGGTLSLNHCPLLAKGGSLNLNRCLLHAKGGSLTSSHPLLHRKQLLKPLKSNDLSSSTPIWLILTTSGPLGAGLGHRTPSSEREIPGNARYAASSSTGKMRVSSLNFARCRSMTRPRLRNPGARPGFRTSSVPASQPAGPDFHLPNLRALTAASSYGPTARYRNGRRNIPPKWCGLWSRSVMLFFPGLSCPATSTSHSNL